MKECHNCGEKVEETYIGKCPKCGEEKGYKISRTINETVDVRDFISIEKYAMEKAFSDALIQYYELLEKNKDNLEIARKTLATIEFLKKKEKEAIDKIEEKARKIYDSTEKIPKKEQSTISFSMGAVIGTEEQRKIQELQNSLKECQNTNEQYEHRIMLLEAEINAKDEVNKKSIIEKINDIHTNVSDIKIKLGWKPTVALGIIASLIASVVFTLSDYVGKVIQENPNLLNSISI